MFDEDSLMRAFGLKTREELIELLKRPMRDRDLAELRRMMPTVLPEDPDASEVPSAEQVARELEEQEMLRRSTKNQPDREGPAMTNHPDSGLEAIAKKAVQFIVELKGLKTAIRPLAAGKASDAQSASDYVDLAVGAGEVTLTTTGFTTVLPAEVKAPGFARIPYSLFEVVFRKPEALGAPSISFEIQSGRMKAGPLAFNNPGITLQSPTVRLADLPLGASLADTLELTLRFSHDELLNSGLWERVLVAQERTRALIEEATKILEPLEVGRDDLNQLVWNGIKHRTESGSKR